MPTSDFYYKLDITNTTSLLLKVEYVYYPYCIGSCDEPPIEEDLSIESVKYSGVEISDSLWDIIIDKIVKAAWNDLKNAKDEYIIYRAESMKDNELEIFNLGK